MQKDFLLLPKPHPNTKPDRRSNSDWTCAPEFPAGVYCLVTWDYAHESQKQEIRRITEKTMHRWGKLPTSDPRFQGLLAAMEQCPPLVITAVAIAEPYGPRDILRRLVESGVVPIRKVIEAATWLSENGPDNADYDETTDRWRDSA